MLPPSHHVFRDYPEHRMQIPDQPNGVDCGLYMLKYIEKIAKHQPDLTGKKRSRQTFDVGVHPELAFSQGDIAVFRKKMRLEIRELGRVQKEQMRVQVQAERPPSLAMLLRLLTERFLAYSHLGLPYLCRTASRPSRRRLHFRL